jgi:tetratricopeptide (TPR) repeat protein
MPDNEHPPPVDLPIVSVAKAESAEAQMALAKSAKSATRGLKGEAQLKQKRAAAQAYSAVARHWSAEKELVTEACYRRGEILRSLGEEGAARGAFEDALEAAPKGNDFSVRALLEIGHVCRRAEQHADAMEFYEKARDRKGVSLRYNNDGREWLARTLLAVLEWKAAEAAAIDWAEHAEGPVEEVKARDRQVLALVGQKRLLAARQLLEQVREEMKPLAAAPTKEGESVRRSLYRMKAPKALAKARSNGR